MLNIQASRHLVNFARLAQAAVRSTHSHPVEPKYLQYDNPLTGRYTLPECRRFGRRSSSLAPGVDCGLLLPSRKELGLPITEDRHVVCFAFRSCADSQVNEIAQTCTMLTFPWRRPKNARSATTSVACCTRWACLRRKRCRSASRCHECVCGRQR